MRYTKYKQILAALTVAATVVATGAPALAGRYDISLQGLGRPLSKSLTDPAVMRYRNLSCELALALAPRPLAPAETLGMSGFEFSVVTTHADIPEGESYWSGQPGTPVFEGVADGFDMPSMLWVPTVHIRKGLPFSTELGVTSSFLAFSQMFLLAAEAKVAVHESFYRWVPSVAVRAAVGSLFGSDDLTVTTAEIDALASLPFGLSGVVQLTPYLGYGLLFTDVTSGVIDETPFSVQDPVSDQRGGPGGSLYTFQRIEWHQNQTHRVFLGARVKFAFLEVLYEMDIGIVDPSDQVLTSHSLKIGFDT